MQTRKRVSGRNACREYASPKVSRAQKKSEKLQGPEKKAAGLITSSARKQRVAGTLLKKSEEFAVTSNLTASLDLMYDDTSNTCLNKNAVNDAHLESKGQVHGGHGGEAGNGLDNIFSPAFHVSKIYGGHISSGDIHEDGAVELSQNNWVDGHIEDAPKLVSGAEMLVLDSAALNSHCGVDLEGVALSSEVSAIYLAMKNSKLECVDEHGQDSLSTEIQVEDEYEEFDEFDPYLFIKNLPALSSVVPTFRPVLLPKQTRRCPRTTLVLDLDETLVHSTLEPCNDADFTFPVNFNDQEHIIYVRCRPHLMDFLERVARIFEIIIFTASQSIYAEQLLNVLDPKRKVFRHRVFRESCVFVDGNYLKDLSILGRDLAHVIIIDNSPQAFGFQVDNGIPIESWFDDRSDQELLLLLPFLESLVEVEDVRPLIAKKFNLREKVAAAVCPPMCSNEGDPLER